MALISMELATAAVHRTANADSRRALSSGRCIQRPNRPQQESRPQPRLRDSLSTIASENSCLAAISELALAARTPDKKYHMCVLMGHSFGGLVLENTISHSMLDASATGARNISPWDMAVAFNPADNAIGSRQLMSELDYLYKYDPAQHAYVTRVPGTEHGGAVPEIA